MKSSRASGVCVLLALLSALPCAHVAAVVLRRTRGQADATGSALADFDHLRFSVIRIQAVSSKFDWSRPFIPGPDGGGLGSGFVVQAEPYPLFVTNAHVVNDAKHVSLQLLLYGARQWEAEVVFVCSKFDIALLVLKQPAVFAEAMGSRNITLQPLKLAPGAIAMGEDVVALGFPLGQDALKISKGNIAGNEEVNGNICIQSTAPISPGSSGGPLLDATGTQVVGVNFAKSTVGENINYVIPAWRVVQLIGKHLHDQPEIPASGNWKRVQARFPRSDLTTVKANEALYALSKGCCDGVYISRVGQRSVFKSAQPPVPAGSFLISVNGHPLDRYGTGLDQGFVADRVFYTDLLFMVKDLSEDIEVATCSGGKVTNHAVSLQWLPEYDRGLRYVDEPHMEGLASAYEMFGDITFMDMTVNHVHNAMESGQPGPVRWLHPDLIAEPRLVINAVRQGSYVASIVGAGAAVTKVNGVKVRTLQDLREHFAPSSGNFWTLETDMGDFVALEFNKSLSDQVTQAGQMNAPYLLTPGVVSAAKKLGIDVGFGMGAEEQVMRDAPSARQRPHAPLASLIRQVAEMVSNSGDAAESVEAVAAGPLTTQSNAHGTGLITEQVSSATCQMPVI